ncbi:PTS lactose transporter subunit IIC [Pseudooceanicola sediminis]|uniref:PTS lactose transporter subunit IIC n=1 Tax=Pseudooceanicola sediminis TaxID=2211117 RepID=A0A399J4T3_9RHOB|nr:PTS sugar transporter subunit IIA [Pseudooceanicola sediminis]KAA2315389.1 PTS lactose transporter subunit IIC [Puniceibacterium sp. HSS470]RII40405.1 PTS lactose transporter subunit IIC [Pseudooceanicola sediminis]|tara:strand:- start:110221 stop:110685 length:465 start_codon:yes stop_codon:yes gene_type:complete
MKLSQILKPEAIKVIASASSKKRLLHDIGELAQSAHGLDQNRVVEALQERESLGPTGVGHGVALPHARLSGIERVQGAFIVLERPVDFDSIDRLPVDLVFALFAPEEAGVEHLKALALVSRSLRDLALCKKLRANQDPATLYAILTSDQNMQAA